MVWSPGPRHTLPTPTLNLAQGLAQVNAPSRHEPVSSLLPSRFPYAWPAHTPAHLSPSSCAWPGQSAGFHSVCRRCRRVPAWKLLSLYLLRLHVPPLEFPVAPPPLALSSVITTQSSSQPWSLQHGALMGFFRSSLPLLSHLDDFFAGFDALSCT